MLGQTGSSAQQIGPYRVVSRLGAGGMGEVYLAHDPRSDRQVAIKMLPSQLAASDTARERLRRGAMAAAALDHPYICTLFDLGEAEGTLFLVMEYIPGETLRQRMAKGPLPPTEALRIASQIADALEHAHERRFVHRDLKPANVMITPQGLVKVMDFGLAKRFGGQSAPPAGETVTSAEPQLTELGAVVGRLTICRPSRSPARRWINARICSRSASCSPRC